MNPARCNQYLVFLKKGESMVTAAFIGSQSRAMQESRISEQLYRIETSYFVCGLINGK
jgi:hypothetical protein